MYKIETIDWPFIIKQYYKNENEYKKDKLNFIFSKTSNVYSSLITLYMPRFENKIFSL